jgi:hypothetical protein
MAENDKSYIDQTDDNLDQNDIQNQRTVEFDISDVEQKTPEEGSISVIPKKKGWTRLILFTLSTSVICAASIFFLTSFFQGSFLLKTKQEPSANQEIKLSEEMDNNEDKNTEVATQPATMEKKTEKISENEVEASSMETITPDKSETPAIILMETPRQQTPPAPSLNLVDTLRQQSIQEPQDGTD